MAQLRLVRPSLMASFLDKLKINGSKFETPLTIRHVESHLIFGPLSRYFAVAYLALIFGLLKFIDGVRNTSFLEGSATDQSQKTRSVYSNGN